MKAPIEMLQTKQFMSMSLDSSSSRRLLMVTVHFILVRHKPFGDNFFYS